MNLDEYIIENGGMILLIDRTLDKTASIDVIIKNMQLKSNITVVLFNDIDSIGDNIPIIIIPIDEYLVLHIHNIINYLHVPSVYYDTGIIQYVKYDISTYTLDNLFINILSNPTHKHVITPKYVDIEKRFDDLSIKYEMSEYGYIIDCGCNKNNIHLHIIDPSDEDEATRFVDMFDNTYKTVHLYYSNIKSRNVSMLLESINNSSLTFIFNINELDILFSVPGNIVRKREEE